MVCPNQPNPYSWQCPLSPNTVLTQDSNFAVVTMFRDRFGIDLVLIVVIPINDFTGGVRSARVPPHAAVDRRLTLSLALRTSHFRIPPRRLGRSIKRCTSRSAR